MEAKNNIELIDTVYNEWLKVKPHATLYSVAFGYSGNYSYGLCGFIVNLLNDGIISIRKYDKIAKLIKACKPKNISELAKISGYYFVTPAIDYKLAYEYRRVYLLHIKAELQKQQNNENYVLSAF